jgi:SAM-dependent methyltransferase/glycosyltransferase involved in cell wall biosynthesis
VRVAYFSPLPPARSGIADYSEALIASLRDLVDLEVFSNAQTAFDPSRFDVALYQVGNNGFHDFVYQTALQHPGVAVMHESNLHHLIADLTIKRGNWDAYVAECEFNGGAAARAFAERVRKLEVGPDYEGIPMTRRLLEASKGVIVHSRFMETGMRQAGYTGPVAVIPHGAWIPQADRNGYRHKLGLDEAAPLIGIFGFLKPYKRVAESLRAFQRLIRVSPGARLILVGEAHPELPVQQMIRSMGLSANARLLGFTPIEEFVGYLGACDIVLNLRYPTVGESSGTLLRALGTGQSRARVRRGIVPGVSGRRLSEGRGRTRRRRHDFRVSQSAGVAAGSRARVGCAGKAVCGGGVQLELRGAAVRGVFEGAWQQRASDRCAPGTGRVAAQRGRVPDRLGGQRGVARVPRNAQDALGEDPRDHSARWSRRPHPRDGRLSQITPALRSKLGYGEVRGCYYGTLGRTDHRSVTSTEGETFECDIDHFNAEKDRFPYPDGHFSTVLCCELIEHLFEDPMHLMSEVNRILRAGGHLVLTTPNVAALRGVSAILQGYHPGFFHAYIRPAESGEVDARHNREYTPREIHKLLETSGFAVERLETGEFRDEPHPEFGWVLHLLERYRLETDLRGDGIYAVGRKTGTVRDRYPDWLYS